MSLFIPDDDLQRLTARFLHMSVLGEKTPHKCQFPGAQLFRITDVQEPGFLMFEQWIGSEKRSRGQLLYLLYDMEKRDPIWRMVVDYVWNSVAIIQDSLEESHLRWYLDECLKYGYGNGRTIHLPELGDDSPDGLFFHDSLDGTLRRFNGQRYITTTARRRRGGLDNELYLGEIQGGTF